MAGPSEPRGFRFGEFEVDLRSGELRREGLKVRLHGQPFRILALLLARPGEVVSRDDLRGELWPADTFVDFDRGLNNAMNRLRDALGDSAETPRFIETLPRHGYRFTAAVNRLDAEPAAPNGGSAPTAGRTPAAVVGHAPERWRHVGMGLLLLAVAVYVAARSPGLPSPEPSQGRGRVRLVVLPFENLSGDAEQEYFSDGMTEELIAQLGGLQPSRLGVIARTSAMHYKGTRQRVDEIGRELRVDYVLEGSVRRMGERVRITAQLIRVGDQTHVWASDYDRSVKDVLEVQSDVAGAVAREIRLQLTSEERARLAPSRPIPAEAHEAYLRGRYFLSKRSWEGLQKSIEYFLQALDREPAYAAAYAGLADAHALLAQYGWLPAHEGFPRAKAAATKALEIDATAAEPHASLGFAKLHYDFDWPGAAREYERALELNPGYAAGHLWYAEYLTAAGAHAEALVEIHKARDLDPFSAVIQSNVGRLLFYARRFPEAEQELKRALALDPQFLFARVFLAMTYAEQGRHGAARAEAEGAAAESGYRMATLLARVHAGAGRRAEARALLAELEATQNRNSNDPYLVAGVYAVLGDKEQALRWLDQAFRERVALLVFAAVDPWLDRLRDDPRFKALVRRVGPPPRGSGSPVP